MPDGRKAGPQALTISETLKLRLEAARVAQERSRVALFASTLVALTIITAGWNAYLSQYRAFAVQHATIEADSTGTSHLQKELLGGWVRSRFITISPLGISVGVGDAPFVGSLALVISTIWHFLSVRRENYTIGRILLDHRGSEDHDLLWHIYHAINSYTIFSRVTHSDSPIWDLDKEPVDHEIKFISQRFGLINFIYFLPAISILFILVFDILSVYTAAFRSPFRHPGGGSLIQEIRKQYPHEEREYWIWWGLTLAIFSYIFMVCFRIKRFASGTERVLRQLLQALRPAGVDRGG